MSPNVYLEFDDDTRMLIATDGETEYRKWTYSDFEKYLNESITPSMYSYMAGYVYDNMTKDELWEIEADDYHVGDLEEAAVNAYFDMPALERKEMHEQELVNLQAEYARVEDKEMAAKNWLLDDNLPFDPTSPLYVEMCQYVRSLATEYEEKRIRLENEIHEEEQWRGGWEENMETDQIYDHADEI